MPHHNPGDIVAAPPVPGETAQTPEELADRFSRMADDLIDRAFAVDPQHHAYWDDRGDIQGIRAYSTNDTGSSGEGGDVLLAGALFGRDSQPWVRTDLERKRHQLPRDESRWGEVGSLTGAYEVVRYTHRPDFSSDHVGVDVHMIDIRGKDKPFLRPGDRDESLETAAAAMEAKLGVMREAVEAAEARQAAAEIAAAEDAQAAMKARALPRFGQWLR